MQSVPIHVLVYIGAYGLLFAKLIATGLRRRYPIFTVYIGFELARSILGVIIPRATNVYAWFYFLTQPVSWVLHALVIREVFHLVLSAHPGIASAGRKAVLLAVAAASLLATVTLAFRGDNSESPHTVLERFLLIERFINTSLLGFLLALLAFLAYFPVRLTRNALVHAAVFGVFFAARTGLWIVRNVSGPEFTATMNAWMPAVVVATLLAWIIFLSNAGELRPVQTRTLSSKEEEERLLAQLESINHHLLRK